MNTPKTIDKNARRFTTLMFDALHGGEHAWEDMTDEQFSAFTMRVKEIIDGRKQPTSDVDYSLVVVAEDLTKIARGWESDRKHADRIPAYRHAAQTLINSATGESNTQPCNLNTQACDDAGELAEYVGNQEYYANDY